MKLIQGNPGKRKIPESGPEPEAKHVDPPKHLSPPARREWRRVMPELVRWGLFTPLDLAQLAIYCEAYARLQDAAGRMKETGLLVKSPKGYPMQSPYLAIYNRAAEQVRQFGEQFGLSPVARTRLKGSAQGDLFDQPSASKAGMAGSGWDDLEA